MARGPGALRTRSCLRKKNEKEEEEEAAFEAAVTSNGSKCFTCNSTSCEHVGVL